MPVILEISECAALMPVCCELATVAVDEFAPPEKALLKEFMPTAQTAVVLAHHVTAAVEWAWFPFECERLNNTCAADLHAKLNVGLIEGWLNARGFAAAILPYPGRCGVAFKYVAAKTVLGELGANYLFLHRHWGPWTHLRVLLTDAVFARQEAAAVRVCDGCQACLQACPAGVIKAGSFDGPGCGEYQKARRIDANVDGSYIWKCEICASVCPQGQKPKPVQITK